MNDVEYKCDGCGIECCFLHMELDASEEPPDGSEFFCPLSGSADWKIVNEYEKDIHSGKWVIK